MCTPLNSWACLERQLRWGRDSEGDLRLLASSGWGNRDLKGYSSVKQLSAVSTPVWRCPSVWFIFGYRGCGSGTHGTDLMFLLMLLKASMRWASLPNSPLHQKISTHPLCWLKNNLQKVLSFEWLKPASVWSRSSEGLRGKATARSCAVSPSQLLLLWLLTSRGSCHSCHLAFER